MTHTLCCLPTALLLALVATTGAAPADTTDAARLRGTWTCYVDYQSHRLEVLDAGQLRFDGERHPYVLREGRIEAAGESYPYRFEDDLLVVTADGRDVYLYRPDAGPAASVRDLLGVWTTRTDWGEQTLTVVSEWELEVEGQRIPCSLQPHALRANGADHPYRLEGGRLTIMVPEEGRRFTFTPDRSVLRGRWTATVDGLPTTLDVLSDRELVYDGQYATYEPIAGGIRVEWQDYPYRFDRDRLIAQIEGREVVFRRDPAAFLGTWQGQVEGRTVSLTFLSSDRVVVDGEVTSYTLTPGSVGVDGRWLAYRFQPDGQVAVVDPKRGRVVFRKVAPPAVLRAEDLTGTWRAQGEWETVTVTFRGTGRLEADGQILDYRLRPGVIEVGGQAYPFWREADAVIAVVDGGPLRFTRANAG